MIATLVSLYYYLAVVRSMYMRPSEELRLAPVTGVAPVAGGAPAREPLPAHCGRTRARRLRRLALRGRAPVQPRRASGRLSPVLMLRRWTAWHEEWADDVGCFAVETADGLVFIDPLDPPRRPRNARSRARHRLLARPRDHGARRDAGLGARRSARPLANRGIKVTRRGRETATAARRNRRVPDRRGAARSSTGCPSIERSPSATCCSARARSRARPKTPLRLCPERWLGARYAR